MDKTRTKPGRRRGLMDWISVKDGLQALERLNIKRFIPEILTIFEETPKIDKDYMCHGEPHSYQVLDKLLIKHKLRELFSSSPFQPENAADAEPQSLENYLKSLPHSSKIY